MDPVVVRGSVEIGPWTVVGRGAGARVRSPISAVVPGSVQASLVGAGSLPPLEQRAAEREWQWVPRQPWEYRTQLTVTAEQAAAGRLELVGEGLDTLAEVRLGSRLLGRTANGLRTHRFDLTGCRAGEHELTVRFAPLFDHLARRNRERALPGWGVGSDKDDTGAWVRKAPVHFGWDFAPKVVPVGLTGPVRLESFDCARLGHLGLRQVHRRGRCDLRLTVELERLVRGPLEVEAQLWLAGEPVVAERRTATGRSVDLTLPVREPALWWPRGMGAQPLYTLTVTLRSGEVAIDAQQRRVGLRRLELRRRRDRRGEGFEFVANGVSLFARGVNWVPPEPVPGLGDEVGRTRALLDDLARVGANLVRVWGGGPYGSEAFYDRCDQLGLLVWQDFPFACATYPSFDRDWLSEVRAEATEHVRRLAHRASLALWCGNNEVENGLAGPRWTETRMGWADYGRLFDRLLPRIVEREGAGTAYWPGSPHSPLGDRMDFNSEGSGDAHLWTVWHGNQPFEAYAGSRHRFVSEFGFQSLPAPASLAEVLSPEQRNLTAPDFEHRQRSGLGTARLLEYLAREHRLPSRFADWAWLSQILQAEGIALGIEHWRRQRPRCRGALLWQWNEPWVAPTWSAVDHAGRFKALAFALERCFAELALSLAVDRARGRVEVYAANDRSAPEQVRYEARLWDLDGELRASFDGGGTVPAGGVRRLGRIELGREGQRRGLRPDALLLEVLATDGAGRALAPGCARLVPWKALALGDPQLQLVDESRVGELTRVRLTCRRPAPWAFVEQGAPERAEAPRPTDPTGLQFLTLFPGAPRELELRCDSSTLRARSIWDLR
jgi:beta-mannosidase